MSLPINRDASLATERSRFVGFVSQSGGCFIAAILDIGAVIVLRRKRHKMLMNKLVPGLRPAVFFLLVLLGGLSAGVVAAGYVLARSHLRESGQGLRLRLVMRALWSFR